MESEVREQYRNAGKIASQIKAMGKDIVKPGVKFLDITNQIEKKIRDAGGVPAFPVNVSINENAAHDTADVNDDRVIGENDVVKLDLGVHIDGYIVDTAVTICLDSQWEEMHKVTQNALAEGVKLLKPGGTIKEVSEVIEKTIREGGFNPVANLTGHGLERYDLHAKIEIPNVKTGIDYTFEDGEVFAVEPFATNGDGYVIESNRSLIYSYAFHGKIRLREGRKILDIAQNEFESMPFATRWLTDYVTPLKAKLALLQLTQIGALESYPVLRERGGGMVTQAEHSVIVGDTPEILTK